MGTDEKNRHQEDHKLLKETMAAEVYSLEAEKPKEVGLQASLHLLVEPYEDQKV